MTLARKAEQRGVSPVVGVVIIVGVVVVTGSIVGAFVSSQISDVEPEPQSSVRYNQDVQDPVQEKYKVTVSVTGMGNSDYLLVTTRGNVGDLDSSHRAETEDELDYVPNQSKFTDIADSNDQAEILVTPGDTATASNMTAGDVVVVYAGIEGRTKVQNEYEVRQKLS